MTRATFPPDRRLHLIDVENLIGSASPSRIQVRRCRQRYTELIGPGAHDLCVVACSHTAAIVVSFEWPDARHIWRSGKDGADLALLEILTDDTIIGRFAGVIVASGDGRFAGPVSKFSHNEIAVAIVANSGSLARPLALAARHLILFDKGPTRSAASSPLRIPVGQNSGQRTCMLST